ncbi:major facilitator superfamily MFS_1 [Candidatus Vecturithrix granuli]|uniref:Major facilitator superfamily MFS_1 n=1 Tax=Vecturithrix granuli TaxID=1499967 RepID=A0A081C6M3_VECG1|nr:major facilitator superfamily MFS_1 [Candidatus Vecturithrix granuli]
MKVQKQDTQAVSPSAAIKFVVLLGIVSLLADMTYEGARSITGPFLALLGASATTVGVVAGFGELIGYSLRLISGYLSDRTGQYWIITLIGYGVNLLAVPLLALAGHWPLAAALMVMERIGKAIRTPARDAMLSHATKAMGRGWGFGLHEAMDQIGAMLGPLIVAAVLYMRGSYRASFGILLVPALLAISVLITARMLYPRPRELETCTPELETKGFDKRFWCYLAAVAFIAAGYADFPLIAYHFGKTESVPTVWIPMFYAVAMGVDAVAALICGYLFDRLGLTVTLFATLIAAGFAPCIFFGNFAFALVGMVLWGIGMGAQESIMRAAVAGMVSAHRRGAAYGFFNTGFGIAWFCGSALMGVLYDVSFPVLIIFSVAIQLTALPLLWIVRSEHSSQPIQEG